MVDRSELYPGAVVTVRGRLSMSTACITAECAMVIFDGPYDSGDHATVPIDAILSVEPRPLAVGVRVRTLGGNKGRIAALTKGEACLVLEPTGFLSSPVLLAELTRIPEDADEPAPAEKAMRFKVGDRVRCTFGDDAGLTGEIAHIRNELAWVDFGDNGDDLKLLEDLERAP